MSRGARRLERAAHIAVTAVAATTALTGLAQVVAPGPVLRAVSGPQTTADRHLFRIVGMFMVVVGGILVDTQRRSEPDPSVLRWVAVQKFGASAGVALGVIRGVFGAQALAAAALDLSSGVLLLWYRRHRMS
jgi:uncharacterized protein YjeT (DUF2065 family)